MFVLLCLLFNNNSCLEIASGHNRTMERTQSSYGMDTIVQWSGHNRTMRWTQLYKMEGFVRCIGHNRTIES